MVSIDGFLIPVKEISASSVSANSQAAIVRLNGTVPRSLTSSHAGWPTWRLPIWIIPPFFRAHHSFLYMLTINKRHLAFFDFSRNRESLSAIKRGEIFTVFTKYLLTLEHVNVSGTNRCNIEFIVRSSKSRNFDVCFTHNQTVESDFP